MVDAINPQHYQFSNGAQVIDISENLTSNGGQVVQYVARACRLDGQVKGSPLEDLRKARWFLDREIERLMDDDPWPEYPSCDHASRIDELSMSGARRSYCGDCGKGLE